jgi:hypothetical protein
VSDGDLRDRARTALLAVLEENELDVSEVGEDRWITMLAGQWKRTIPLLLHLDERSLKLTSLLAGVPDEGHVDVYRILLSRNQRPTPVHFGLDDEGDLILTGALPLEVVDAERLDGLLGLVLTLCDETYNAVLRAGFGDYIATEQAWRSKVGLPPNPVSSSG